MNFSVAIDFTLSNGDPKDPRSLHFLDQSTWENQYTQAIKAVGEIIEDYDFDKQFPALGFGGRVPPAGEVSHEFFLNLQDNPFALTPGSQAAMGGASATDNTDEEKTEESDAAEAAEGTADKTVEVLLVE